MVQLGNVAHSRKSPPAGKLYRKLTFALFSDDFRAVRAAILNSLSENQRTGQKRILGLSRGSEMVCPRIRLIVAIGTKRPANQSGSCSCIPPISSETVSVNLIRRYWGACLIVMMVVVHAAVIGYVRSRVSRLSDLETTVVAMGSYRFQPVDNLTTVYHFKLHAVIDPTKMRRGEEGLHMMRMQIRETAEQTLRQVDPKWLEDPTQSQIRDRLMKIVHKHLEEPLVQRMLITDWLELPVQSVDLQLDRPVQKLALQ